MPNTLLLDHVVYHITSDSNSIRHLDSYQKVRDEINSRCNPLSGSTNWQEVYSSCQLLAKGAGIDLLMSSYLTIAKLKIEGLSGYANGLELLMNCLSLLPQPDAKSAKMRKEILDWVNNKAIFELKNMRPSQEQLRDLYFSERMCDRIYNWMKIQQPNVEVDFEGVCFVLFEHIDQIETRYHTVLKRREKQCNENQRRVSANHSRFRLATTFCITAVVCLSGAWLYFNHRFWTENQFKQSVDVPALTATTVGPYIEKSTTMLLASVQSELVPMYQSSIEQKVQASIEQPYLKAIDQLDVLQKLYAESEQVNQISQALSREQILALEQTNQLVARFAEVRTKIANITLLVKNRRFSQIESEMKSLQEFAVSLSPIYGRVGYIENLLKKQQYQQAKKELDELISRLNNLSWKVATLHVELSTLME